MADKAEHGSGLDTRYSVGFLRALSQCLAADGATDMLEGVNNAIKISDTERGMPLHERRANHAVKYRLYQIYAH